MHLGAPDGRSDNVNEPAFKDLTVDAILSGAVHPEDICGTLLLKCTARYSQKKVASAIERLYCRVSGPVPSHRTIAKLVREQVKFSGDTQQVEQSNIAGRKHDMAPGASQDMHTGHAPRMTVDMMPKYLQPAPPNDCEEASVQVPPGFINPEHPDPASRTVKQQCLDYLDKQCHQLYDHNCALMVTNQRLLKDNKKLYQHNRTLRQDVVDRDEALEERDMRIADLEVQLEDMAEKMRLQKL